MGKSHGIGNSATSLSNVQRRCCWFTWRQWLRERVIMLLLYVYCLLYQRNLTCNHVILWTVLTLNALCPLFSDVTFSFILTTYILPDLVYVNTNGVTFRSTFTLLRPTYPGDDDSCLPRNAGVVLAIVATSRSRMAESSIVDVCSLGT